MIIKYAKKYKMGESDHCLKIIELNESFKQRMYNHYVIVFLF